MFSGWRFTLAMALVAIFVLAQAIRPARTNPAIDPAMTLQTPAEVSAILTRACADCHSSETRWPWYTQVAPASWYIIHDVNEGRGELSLSEWGRYTPQRKERKLQEICAELNEGAMPPVAYTWMHREATLTEADRLAVCAWATSERARLVAAH